MASTQITNTKIFVFIALLVFKGYLRYKTIFCYSVALDVLMDFFI